MKRIFYPKETYQISIIRFHWILLRVQLYHLRWIMLLWLEYLLKFSGSLLVLSFLFMFAPPSATECLHNILIALLVLNFRPPGSKIGRILLFIVNTGVVTWHHMTGTHVALAPGRHCMQHSLQFAAVLQTQLLHRLISTEFDSISFTCILLTPPLLSNFSKYLSRQI